MRPHSRGAMRPRLASVSPSLKKRGRRESRAPIAPAVVRTKNARVDHRFNRIIPAFPARMVYGLLRALPGERAFLPPSPCGLTMHPGPGWADTSPQDLTPASRRQDHTTSPYAPVSPKLSPDLVRSGQFRRRRLAAPFVRTPADRSRETRPAIPCAPDAVASIASHRAFVTFAKRPLSGETGESAKGDLPDVLSGIFLREGLDRCFADLPVGSCSLVFTGRQGAWFARSAK